MTLSSSYNNMHYTTFPFPLPLPLPLPLHVFHGIRLFFIASSRQHHYFSSIAAGNRIIVHHFLRHANGTAVWPWEMILSLVFRPYRCLPYYVFLVRLSVTHQLLSLLHCTFSVTQSTGNLNENVSFALVILSLSGTISLSLSLSFLLYHVIASTATCESQHFAL